MVPNIEHVRYEDINVIFNLFYLNKDGDILILENN